MLSSVSLWHWITKHATNGKKLAQISKICLLTIHLLIAIIAVHPPHQSRVSFTS